MAFDDIRCYNDSEVQFYLTKLTDEKQFMKVLSTVYPLMPKEQLKQKLLSFQTAIDFQKEMVYPFLQYIEANLTKGIEIRGVEKLEKNKNYLYISNHRDIILDSALLCAKLIENGMDTVEIAIGDNLLVFPWIEDLVRVNKSFIVRRGLSAKQILESSRELASYIKFAIHEKKQSVWIAQREGRAKDSNDRTQESLLKMFNMSGSQTIPQNLAELNICPLAISYEYDPCDYLKAKEFQQKRDNPDYKKSPADDLLNMQTGVMGYKGKVVYQVAGEISNEILNADFSGNHKNEIFSGIAQMIDHHIFKNYHLFEVNKIAFDLLNGTEQFAADYSLMQKLDFEKYLEKQIEKIEMENKDFDFLMTKLLEMYANPLKNALNI